MDFISVLLFACALTFGTLQVCNGRDIILNEDKLMDTCTGTCPEIPTLYKKGGCRKISGCKKNSEGWTRGFVRCDYCKCNCEEDTAMEDVTVVRTHLSITEPDLLGTCTSTCDKGGLVRSNFKGCQEVRDCSRARKGWTRGWVRCDYCTCGCINRIARRANKYTLTNVHYDLSNLDLEGGTPIVVADTILENSGDHEQTATRELTVTTTQITTMETSTSMQVGLEVTVKATAGVPNVASVETSVTASLSTGFTYKAGSSWTETKSDKVSVEIKAPPHRSIKAIVTGVTRKIDIPYSANLVTTYEGGRTATKRVTGFYSDVETTRFRVQYESPKPI